MNKRNTIQSIEFFALLATKGRLPVAQFMLGIIYFEGDEGVKQDLNAGLAWLKLAARNGWTQAMMYLAQYYYLNMKENQEKAIYWFKKVAEQDDNIYNPVNDGTLYLFENAEFEIRLNDSKINNLSDQVVLLVKYAREYDKEDDRSKILFWDLMTNKKSIGLCAAQLGLAKIYREGSENIAIDKKESMFWLKMAGKNGSPIACLTLGSNYENATGVEQDYQEAMRWYTKSRDFGRDEVDTFFCLGCLYYYGLGIDRNYRIALSYFCASNRNVENGQVYYLMGSIYEIGGDGVEQDYWKAIESYTKAAEHGCVDAPGDIGLLFYNGKGVSKDHNKAFDWFSKGASMQCPLAQYMLADMHSQGYKGQVDLSKALQLYRKALEGGYDLAEQKIEQTEKLLMEKSVVSIEDTNKS